MGGFKLELKPQHAASLRCPFLDDMGYCGLHAMRQIDCVHSVHAGRRALAWPFRAWAALADARRSGTLACKQRPAAKEPDQAASQAPPQRRAEAGSSGLRRRRLAAAFWHWQAGLAQHESASMHAEHVTAYAPLRASVHGMARELGSASWKDVTHAQGYFRHVLH